MTEKGTFKLQRKQRVSTMISFAKCRGRFPVLIAIMIIALIYLVFNGFFINNSEDQYPFNVPDIRAPCEVISTRRTLAKQILDVQRQIEVASDKGSAVDAVWAVKLLSVAAELDPRVSISQEEKERIDKFPPDPQSKNSGYPGIPTNPSSPQEPQDLLSHNIVRNASVCAEKYLGRFADFHLQNNFAEVNCTNIPKFRTVLTIVLSTKGWEYSRIVLVVKNIKQVYDVDILVLIYNNTFPDHINISNTFIKQFTAETHESLALNHVISTVSTPYILVSNSLTQFSSQSSLKRIVRMFDELQNIDVVAGAYRNLKGNWSHGCLQHTMENYQLAYAHGYQYSRHGCMYCDDALGPFIARTKFLKSIPFMESFEGSLMFRDWFLSVRMKGGAVMACPDVMFFVDAEPVMRTVDWLKLSQKWSFQNVKAFHGEDLHFTCEEINIKCVNLRKAVASFLLPPCCREAIRKELGYFQDCAEEMGLYYEMSAGTNLGAVKMDGILPWDFDVDVHTDCKDQQIWMTKGMECMSRKGCLSYLRVDNYWQSHCSFSTLDITCRYNETSHLPLEYRHIPTTILYDGRITNLKPNPGKVVRNHYGPEFLKHATHWRYANLESTDGTVIDDGSAPAGMWNPCKEPGYHSCLDRFPHIYSNCTVLASP